MKESKLQLVEKSNTRLYARGGTVQESSLEAYHIAPRAAQDIADEARMVRSSRVVARKYKIPQRVVQDCICFYPARKPPAEMISIPVAALRRRA